MAGLAYQLAIASKKVSCTVIDTTGFPRLVEAYSVDVVPKMVVNGRTAAVEAPIERDLSKAVVEASRDRTA